MMFRTLLLPGLMLFCLISPVRLRGQSVDEYNDKARLYSMYGLKDSANHYAKLAWKKAQEPPVEQDESYATAAFNLGFFYDQLKMYSQAEPLLLKALEVRQKNPRTAPYDRMLTLQALGKHYRSVTDMRKALNYFRTAFHLSVSLREFNPYERLPFIEDLAWSYHENDNNREAIRLLDSTITRARQAGARKDFYVNLLTTLGLIYDDAGDYQHAEPLLQESLDIAPTNATTKNNLGLIYNNMSNYERSIPLLESALNQTKSETPIKDSVGYACMLANLASAYRAIEKYNEARPLLEEAVRLRKAGPAADEIAYALLQRNLASSYLDSDNFTQAKALYQNSSAIELKARGPLSLSYASSLLGISHCDLHLGLLPEAEKLSRQAVEICRKATSEQSLEYFDAISSLAGIYYAENKFVQAQPLFLAGKKIIFARLNQLFSFLSGREKELYIQNITSFYKNYQSFNRKFYKLNPDAAGEAYDLELLSKGLVLNSELLTRQTALNDPEAMRIFQQWHNLQNKVLQLGSLQANGRPANGDSLKIKADLLARQLTAITAKRLNGNLVTAPDWQKVQNKLSLNEAAIEFMTVHCWDRKRLHDTVRYSALILKKGWTKPVRIDLCRQEELDELAGTGDNHRHALEDLYVLSGRNPARLYNLIWKPLETWLQPGDHIYYALAGTLHQLAFAAIPLPDSKLLSERYHLSLVHSTASLLQDVPEIKPPLKPMVIFAGIAYDQPIRDLTAKPSAIIDPFYLAANRTRSINNFDPLPGTLTEYRSIDTLAKKAHIRLQPYLRNQATEENYKSAAELAQPGIIHIATHGFYLADAKKLGVHIDPESPGASFRNAEDPLNRAGLAFAGGNHTWKGEPVPQGHEDGILTAAEIAVSNLSGKPLVVLSACETALGEIKGSEGVYGLQRAFKLAGAGYLLMSLWRIPDNETALYMKTFYQDLFSGHTVDHAYQTTQEKMKKWFPNQPYVWAAFVLAY